MRTESLAPARRCPPALLAGTGAAPRVQVAATPTPAPAWGLLSSRAPSGVFGGGHGVAWEPQGNRLLLFGSWSNALWQWTAAGGWQPLTANGASGSPSAHHQHVHRNPPWAQPIAQARHLGASRLHLWLDDQEVEVALLAGVPPRVRPKDDDLRARRRRAEQLNGLANRMLGNHVVVTAPRVHH